MRHQAPFHPRKYPPALADDLRRRGGAVDEGTRVVGLSEGEPCVPRTDAGVSVRADEGVVATHYPVFDRALLFTRLSPRRELVVAGTVDEDRAPRDMHFTPEQSTRSVRSAPYRDGRRLLIVTGEHSTPGTADVEERFARLSAWAGDRFEGFTLTHRWATQDNDSTDSVPLVGPMRVSSDHTYLATRFGGWGLSGGIVAGRMNQAKVGRHFLGGRPSSVARPITPEDTPRGEGAVVRVGARHCAVHRDEKGELRAVSARCTHLGCLVAFNRAEQAWECPCHGSRFAPDGSILHGAAVRPLERRDI